MIVQEKLNLKEKISEIKNKSSLFTKLSDDEIRFQSEKLKKKAESFKTFRGPLANAFIIEYFAIIQEISFRVSGLKHFDNQLLAGLLLNEGKIVEMKTGEGKTLASSLPIALNALSKKGVHVVTVNEYLAERDQKWMGKIFESLGLSVGLVKNGMTLKKKAKNYKKDITYLTNSELVFDFLRDNASYNSDDLVQRELNFCLIDEIDSVLIDEARTPLILSNFEERQNFNKLYFANFLSFLLEKNIHFEIDEKRKDIHLTDLGYKEISKLLGKKSLYESSDPWILEILNALKAKHLFKLNKDYIILNDKIAIVDEFTGRLMEDRRWGMGLHEAIEIKENIKSEGGSKNRTSITYQNFFPLYSKLCGMTGTGKTAEREFKEIYNLDVVVIPTHKKTLRKDLNDSIYQSELSKWKSVLNKAKECFQKGQPILIGTTSIEKSEFLSDLFKLSQIPHQVLNAKPENLFRENEIVAQAGKEYAVTIATNMAGRGTDIVLGGNIVCQIKERLKRYFFGKESFILEDSKYPEDVLFIQNEYKSKNFDLKELIDNLPYSLDKSSQAFKLLYKKLYKECFPIWAEENKRVKELGGLFVLGTERHENRRIDNQLRGRSGRQGDPGFSQFFLSLEDDLIKIFAADNVKQLISSFLEDKDQEMQAPLLSRSLEKAQERIENYNYELRRNVFEYDSIINGQREVFFKIRRDLLEKSHYENLCLRYLEQNFEKDNDLIFYKDLWIKFDLLLSRANSYQKTLFKSGKSSFILEIMDFYWTEHIERMNYVKDTISWKSYGQLNPLIEYNLQAIKSFNLMFEQMKEAMIYCFIKQAGY